MRVRIMLWYVLSRCMCGFMYVRIMYIVCMPCVTMVLVIKMFWCVRHHDVCDDDVCENLCVIKMFLCVRHQDVCDHDVCEIFVWDHDVCVNVCVFVRVYVCRHDVYVNLFVSPL